MRGYGTRHKALRALLNPAVSAGRVKCARCGEPILVGQRWDLGHTDDRQGYVGPEHAYCNRADGALKARRGTGVPSRDGSRRGLGQTIEVSSRGQYGARPVRGMR